MTLDPTMNPCAKRIANAEFFMLRKTPAGWRMIATVRTEFGRYSGVVSFLMAPEAAREEWR